MSALVSGYVVTTGNRAARVRGRTSGTGSRPHLKRSLSVAAAGLLAVALTACSAHGGGVLSRGNITVGHGHDIDPQAIAPIMTEFLSGGQSGR
jgi:hypothetical protein